MLWQHAQGGRSNYAENISCAAAAAAGCPAWAGGRQVAAAAAGVLQSLLEPSEYESEAIKQVGGEPSLPAGGPCLLIAA